MISQNVNIERREMRFCEFGAVVNRVIVFPIILLMLQCSNRYSHRSIRSSFLRTSGLRRADKRDKDEKITVGVQLRKALLLHTPTRRWCIHFDDRTVALGRNTRIAMRSGRS